MQKVIAKIRLNPGQGGFFDPITRIHLTHGTPEAEVLSGMNTTALKAAVRNKRISLISGSLGEYVPPFKLIRNNDGKIAIVSNKENTETKVTENKPATKQKVKSAEAPATEETKPEEIKTEEPQPEVSVAPDLHAIEEIKVEETKPEEIKAEEDLPTLAVFTGVVEEQTADISEEDNPFETSEDTGTKKRKKKK